MNATFRPLPDRRFAALALTALVHALLLLGWQATRRLPAVSAEPDGPRIQWIDLRPRAPSPARSVPAPPASARAGARVPAPVRAPAPAATPAPAAQAAPAMTLYPPAPGPAAPAAAPAASAAADGMAGTAPAPGANGTGLVERARREVGAVDRALAKENNPYIVAPLDSPQIRMRKKMEAAHDMAPPKLFEAPKMEELANPSGDGRRDVRVRTALGTYCISAKSVGMAMAQDPTGRGGELRTTTCLAGEEPPAAQEWRTARDR